VLGVPLIVAWISHYKVRFRRGAPARAAA